MRAANFDELAMALPLNLFKHLISRDDLICQSESDVLRLVERYVFTRPQS